MDRLIQNLETKIRNITKCIKRCRRLNKETRALRKVRKTMVQQLHQIKFKNAV